MKSLIKKKMANKFIYYGWFATGCFLIWLISFQVWSNNDYKIKEYNPVSSTVTLRAVIEEKSISLYAGFVWFEYKTNNNTKTHVCQTLITKDPNEEYLNNLLEQNYPNGKIIEINYNTKDNKRCVLSIDERKDLLITWIIFLILSIMTLIGSLITKYVDDKRNAREATRRSQINVSV